jgi:hypothetical protein
MFGIVTLFTVLAKFGVVKFESLQTENITKDNYEFFFYLYLFFTGMLAASTYEKRSWFRRFIKAFTGLLKSIYLGFSGSLVGWSFGLLVYVLLKGEFGSVALGMVLTSYMLLFSMAPAWYHEQIETEKEKMVGYIFREPRFAKLFIKLGWVFIIASLSGFYDYFSA